MNQSVSLAGRQLFRVVWRQVTEPKHSFLCKLTCSGIALGGSTLCAWRLFPSLSAQTATPAAGPPAQNSWPYTGAPEAMGFSRIIVDSDDVAMRQCRVEAKGFGKKAGQLICKNPTNRQQKVRLPRGYMFLPESPDMQTLIVENDYEFYIEPNGSQTQEFDAFCGYSKGWIPRGPMRISGLKAPPSVLGGQSKMWEWTRPWERAKPRVPKSSGGGGGGGWLRGLAGMMTGSNRPAAEQARILQQSYGIDAKQHKALQEKLAAIDKNPKQFQRNAARDKPPLRGNPSQTSKAPTTPKPKSVKPPAAAAQPPPPRPASPPSSKK
eukprot:TRINITY_DN65973_c0_g1_i1.p1 TRINITY_DN65973_c0_g1~~TRINITY_DN65973_c0_g1_i1.p1  ORF type:complete len:322 (-),score=30.79 TRINITY_DN65973_c0_g1_i1:192-1157(-)